METYEKHALTIKKYLITETKELTGKMNCISNLKYRILNKLRLLTTTRPGKYLNFLKISVLIVFVLPITKLAETYAKLYPCRPKNPKLTYCLLTTEINTVSTQKSNSLQKNSTLEFPNEIFQLKLPETYAKLYPVPAKKRTSLKRLDLISNDMKNKIASIQWADVAMYKVAEERFRKLEDEYKLHKPQDNKEPGKGGVSVPS